MVLPSGAQSQVFYPWFPLVTVFPLSAKQSFDKRQTLEQPLWEGTGYLYKLIGFSSAMCPVPGST